MPGCGPGGRGFESRRSPLKDALQTGTFRGSSESPFRDHGVNSGTDAHATTPGTRADGEGDEPPLRLRGDEGSLFAAHADQLLKKVAENVTASREDVEDACNFAWLQFLRCQPDRDREWQGWLFKTAQREAWRLNARHRGIVRIDASHDVRNVVHDIADAHDPYEARFEFQAAMQELQQLPERLQAVVLLNALLGRHQDVAEVLGVSRQRVAQLVHLSAAHLLRLAERRAVAERPVASPRLARLRELEAFPPAWLIDTIGQAPNPGKSAAGVSLAWRRAALAIDDHRKLVGHESLRDALGPVPIEPAARRSYARAQRAIEEVTCERERRHRGRAIER